MPERLFGTRTRTVVGLMSGTSVDGVDACLVELRGSGQDLELAVLAKNATAYPRELREVILRNSDPDQSCVPELSQLNFRLAYEYRDAINGLLAEAGKSYVDVDLVGCHGQTFYHIPVAENFAGKETVSTLQLGDPSVLANLIGVPVVGDFRVADMAVGGQGAPLVSYFDQVFFADVTETRVLLNLGGIANVTVLPSAETLGAVIAFDTGPANMVSDWLCQELLGERYDAGGARAAAGKANQTVVENFLSDAYFSQPPPKSTGREYFGADYACRFLTALRSDGTDDTSDILASACSLTARSVMKGVRVLEEGGYKIDRVVAAGGGVHNAAIMNEIEELLGRVPLQTTSAFGLDPDIKEAACFAVLAHEAMNGVPNNVPSVTGATRPVVMGKICLPG